MCSGFRKIRQTMEGLVFVAREFFVNGLWQLAKCLEKAIKAVTILLILNKCTLLQNTVITFTYFSSEKS